MSVFIRFQVLFLSALSAHAIAGGSLFQTPNLLWQSIGIAAALFSFRNLKLEGPTLALLILFIQSSSHFLLGGGSYQSESRMTLAHLLSGVLSYAAISYFEIAQDYVISVFIALVPERPFSILSLPELSSCTYSRGNCSIQIHQLSSFLKFRGPPLSWRYL